MKKILIILTIALMSLSNVYAKGDYALRHANPLPNLVRVSIANAEALHLSKEQVASIKDWGKRNRPTIKALVKKVMSEEKMLREEALTTDKDVPTKAEAMLEARRDIIKLKTLCRVNLRSVLTKEQYAQLISIYRNNSKK